MYKRFLKRPFDIVISSLFLLLLSPVLLLIALLVRIKLGSPVLFRQLRPGRKDKSGKEQIFTLYKFRSMTQQTDPSGSLLPDSARLTPFGAMLRKTSLDELPELWNILKGDMSMIGPRPLLVKDMVFMSERQRHRHDVRPGLSGLAQIKGRNCIHWENKLEYDLRYIEKIRFSEDMRILLVTVAKVLRMESISEEGRATSEDFGDCLLRENRISPKTYEEKIRLSETLCKTKTQKDDKNLIVKRDM